MNRSILPLLRAFLDLLLYSHIWIGLAAAAMCAQTDWLLFGRLRWQPLWGFVFFGTMFVYSLHRLFSIRRVGEHDRSGRFATIGRFRRSIWAGVLISTLAGGWFFLQLSPAVQWSLVVPCLLSLGYVLPVVKGRRRLRDLHFLKIFLLALTWSWITAALPAVDRHWLLTAPALLLCLERALFIFALSLPFDIRDLPLDEFAQVKTLPSQLGAGKTKILAAVTLLLMLGFSYLNFRLDVYRMGTLLALVLSALYSYLLIVFSDRVRHDYYFSGLLDGAMILQFALVWGLGAR